MKPYVVRDGDYLEKIARTAGCREDEIWNHPKNRELRDEGRTKEDLVPGDVLYVPAARRPPLDLALRQPNPVVGQTPRIDISIDVLDASGKPEAVGTPYRLTAAGRVLREATMEMAGKVVAENVATFAAVGLEWGERIEYGLPEATPGGGAPSWYTPTELAPSRARVLAPGSKSAMTEEAAADVDPDQVEHGDCGDRYRNDAAAFHDADHPCHHLARKVLAMMNIVGALEPTGDAAASSDNRWYASHPLVPHVFLVPKKRAAGSKIQATHIHVKKGLQGKLGQAEPDGKRTWTATARADSPWYDRRGKNGQEVHLLGEDTPLIKPGPAPFMNLANAANKRLVKLWMGELKHLVPAAEHPWLRRWFGSPSGRAHFRSFCQIVSRIGHWPGPPGPGKEPNLADEHIDGAAIDIDKEYNPWAPLFADGGKPVQQMTGEGGGGIRKDPSVGRAYDRALRLFVAPQVDSAAYGDDLTTAQAWYLASNYFRNAYDWTPETLHAVYCRYQVLNWSLIAYFDYRFGRAAVRKSPTLGSNSTCPLGKRREGKALWEMIEDDYRGLRIHPDAHLLLEADKLRAPPTDLGARLTRTVVKYPFDQTNRVDAWIVPLREIVAKVKDDEKAFLGEALAKQIDHDHFKLLQGIVRDPCRGVFNLSYDVVMAFGRMLIDESEYKNLRMLSFGQSYGAAGGDFMHIDYGKSGKPRF